MHLNTNNNQWFKWAPAFIFAVLLIVLYKTLDNFGEIKDSIHGLFRSLSPFLLAILIVYFLYIPCEKMESLYKKSIRSFIVKRARGLSILTVYSALVLIIALIMTFVIPILIKSLIEFAGSVPAYYKHIMEKFPDNEFLNDFDMSDFYHLLDPIKLEQLGKSIVVFTSGIFNMVISLVVSLYILLDRENITNFFRKISKVFFKEKIRGQLKKYLRQINKVIFAFILGKSIDSMINALVVTSILLILDVKYAFLLGIICGIANFIPYLGTLVAVAFACVITLITGGMPKAITTLIALIIFQQLDCNFIEPKIMGKTLKINPLLIIFAVIMGGAYFGVIGMFLAVPVITIIKQILLEYIDSKNAHTNTPTHETDGSAV